MNNRPLLDRLTPASTRALLIWCVSYALNHRDEITPATLVEMRQGNEKPPTCSPDLGLI